MDKYDHFFTPDHVDEQIEDNARERPATLEDQFLAELHEVARQIRAEQESSLQRTWLRLQQKNAEYAASTQQKREHTMQGEPFTVVPHDIPRQLQKKPARRIQRAVSITFAVAIAASIIIAWATIPFIHSFGQRTQTGSGPTAQSAHLVCSVQDTVAPAGFSDTNDLEWSSSGKIVFTNSDALTVNGANCTRGEHYQNNMPGVTTASWSPDGKYLLVLTSVRSTKDKAPYETDTLSVLDGNGKVLTSTILSQNAFAEVTPIATRYMSSLSGGSISNVIIGPVWSPDGYHINVIIGPNNPGAVWKSWIWDAHHHTLTLDQSQAFHPAIEGIFGFVWSPDRKYLMVSTSNIGLLTAVLDARTGVLVKKLGFTSTRTIAPVSWSPDGKEIAAFCMTKVGASVQIAELSTGKVVRTLPLPHGVFLAEEILDIVWSPDGKYIAWSPNGQTAVTILDVQTGTEVTHINVSGDHTIGAFAWSPDSQRLAVMEFKLADPNQGSQSFMSIWEI